MTRIRAILSDIGEVVLAVHYDRLGQAIAARTGQSIQQVHDELRPCIARFEHDIETGRMTLREGYARCLGALHKSMPYEQFEAAWQSAIGDDYQPVRRAYHALRPDVGLYVLSNTNDAHAVVVRRHWLARLARELWLSNEIGLAKPDPAIFAFAIQRIGLSPREILFLDDRPENIAAAREASLSCLHVTDPSTIPSHLETLGLLT